MSTFVSQDIFVTTADGYQSISQYYEEVVNTGIDFIREMYPEVSDIYIQKRFKTIIIRKFPTKCRQMKF